MPGKVVKRGEGYAVVNKNTGKTVGHSKTRAKAEANKRAYDSHGYKRRSS